MKHGKRAFLVLLILFGNTSLVLANTLQADAVTCLSHISPCNMSSDRDYYYGVTLEDRPEFFEETLSHLVVATLDGVESHYTDVIVRDSLGNTLSGWSFSVVANIDSSLWFDAPYTEHGVITTNDGQAPYKIVWTTETAITTPGTYYFGFNNARAPIDAGWIIDLAATDWSAAVALGIGPVHAPVPEPSTLVLLVAGLPALMVYVRKR